MGRHGGNHPRALRTGFRLMARFIAFNAIFFLLPFAIYAAWLRRDARHRRHGQ